MKRFLKTGICLMMTAVLGFQTIVMAEDKFTFTAKKSAVRIEKAGEILECIVSSKERNFFSYKAQLVYDKDLFEFVEADPVYIQGEPQDIKYMSDNLPEGIAYNVPNSKVYVNNEVKCGYYGEESSPGMFRTISTIMGYEGRQEGDEVLKVTLKSKKAGDGFIYLMDEETAILNEDKTITNNTAKTEFAVKIGSDEMGSTEITDIDDVAYPWRKSETTVFQQSDADSKFKSDQITGELYNVSYANKNADINVLPDGTVVCTIPMDKGDDYTPVVARKAAFGGTKRINRTKYDAVGKKLIFAVDDFGDYVIADISYELSDCAKGTDEYKAVCYLKSIGVLDEKATTFAPNQSITKAEFIKMLVCCMGDADTSALVWFKDVSLSDWHYKYIATAVKKGIITDNGKEFYPDALITAGEAKAMLQKVSDVINGSGTITLDKTGNLTRGEAAVAMQNMLWLKLR